MGDQEGEFSAGSSTSGPSCNAENSAPSSKKKLKKYTVEKKLEVVGSGDDLIHCFESDGPIPAGCDFLRNARIDAEAQSLAEVLD
jgi:hypothetical protein